MEAPLLALRPPLALLVAISLGLCACDAEVAKPEPALPEAVENLWTKARECRLSHEHWLHSVNVVVNDVGLASYTSWQVDAKQAIPFPEGSVVVKPEYDDQFCQHLIGYTVMRKQAKGWWPEGSDWRWQKLDAQRQVIQDGKLDKACVSCHQWHCAPPNGFDLTCTPD